MTAPGGDQPDDPPEPDDGQMHDSWQQLPAPERREYLAREIAEGRHMMLMREPLDSDLLDLAAMVEVARHGEIHGPGDLRAVFDNCDKIGVVIAAVKVIAEMLDEQGVSGDYWKVWASYALVRS